MLRFAALALYVLKLERGGTPTIADKSTVTTNLTVQKYDLLATRKLTNPQTFYTNGYG